MDEFSFPIRVCSKRCREVPLHTGRETRFAVYSQTCPRSKWANEWSVQAGRQATISATSALSGNVSIARRLELGGHTLRAAHTRRSIMTFHSSRTGMTTGKRLPVFLAVPVAAANSHRTTNSIFVRVYLATSRESLLATGYAEQLHFHRSRLCHTRAFGGTASIAWSLRFLCFRLHLQAAPRKIWFPGIRRWRASETPSAES